MTAQTTGWLSPDGILLHIGAHKAGTTAIQNALSTARPRLLEQGVSYPGTTEAHHRAAAAAARRVRGFGDDRGVVDRAAWTSVAQAALAHPGRTVLSSETFTEVDDRGVRRIAADLTPSRTFVTLTLRPFERILPSTWQEALKGGLTEEFDVWLRAILDRDPAMTPSFWRRNDVAAVLGRWIDIVGAHQVAVICLPPDDPTFLPTSFESLIGLSPSTLSLPVSGRSNRSLSAVEAEIVRQINVSVHGQLTRADYHRLLRRGAWLSLVRRREPGSDEGRVSLPAWARECAGAESQAVADWIRRSGVTVVGDLSWLTPTLTSRS